MLWGFWASASASDPGDESSRRNKRPPPSPSPEQEDEQRRVPTTPPPSAPSSPPPPTKSLGKIRSWLSPKDGWNSIVNSTDWIQFTEARTIIPTLLISGGILACFRLHRKYLRRIPEASYITPKSFRRRSLLGRVTSVGDGDNFRLYHTPGGWLAGWDWLRKVPVTKKELKQETIHVRLAGVDAPELAHFGRPAQPFAEEAHTWLTNFLLRRRVRSYIYRADQYARVVGTVYVYRWLFFRQDVSLRMLREGMATVYEAKTGVEFGGEKMEKKYRAAEALAKRKRRGMWKGAKKAGDDWESPREYKTRMAGTDSGSDGK